MGKYLHLLRHAKSSWESAALSDHERPLNRRGVEACALIREHLAAGPGRSIDLVLCSTAVRTRETLELIEDGLPGDVEVRFERSIYEASAEDLRGLLRSALGAAGVPLLIGHNPAIGELASRLTGEGEAGAIARMRAKYPTGALASLALADPGALAGGSARLESFVRPKDLARP